MTPSPSTTPILRRFEVFCAVFKNLTAVLTVSVKLIRNLLLIYESFLQEAQRHCVNRTACI